MYISFHTQLAKVSLKPISDGVPSQCSSHLDWAFNTGKNQQPESYSAMNNTCGVVYDQATIYDFQRFFKCKEIHKSDCNDQGLQFPTVCSCPPCNQCTASCQG